MHQRRNRYLRRGFRLLKDLSETKLQKHSTGAGVSYPLALITEVRDVSRLPAGKCVASSLGLTTSKYISGTTRFRSGRITKQGSPKVRYAAITLVFHVGYRVSADQRSHSTA